MPQLRGGGVVFGPRNDRNFKVDMPKKQRRKALFSALSLKAAENQIMALDKYEGDIKVKTFAAMIAKLPIERNVLVVIPGKNEAIQKSSNNLPNVKTILVGYLNIADLQKYRNILFLEEALTKMTEVFGGTGAQGEAKKKTLTTKE